MTGFDDGERLCLAAVWADGAVQWLGDQLERGHVRGVTDEARLKLDTLHDGLRTLADTLHVLTLPYPPPSVPPATPHDGHLRVVK